MHPGQNGRFLGTHLRPPSKRIRQLLRDRRGATQVA